jgi:hypothetical protein
LPGYEVRIIDGNHIGGTEHRLKVLRAEAARALPGQAIAVLDPQREMVVDVFSEEAARVRRVSRRISETRQMLMLKNARCCHQYCKGLQQVKSGLLTEIFAHRVVC